jgi:hypothetical protein
MRPSRRRSSRARPRPAIRATTPMSWLSRWEALQDQQEAELARFVEPADMHSTASTGRRPGQDAERWRGQIVEFAWRLRQDLNLRPSD